MKSNNHIYSPFPLSLSHLAGTVLVRWWATQCTVWYVRKWSWTSSPGSSLWVGSVTHLLLVIPCVCVCVDVMFVTMYVWVLVYVVYIDKVTQSQAGIGPNWPVLYCLDLTCTSVLDPTCTSVLDPASSVLPDSRVCLCVFCTSQVQRTDLLEDSGRSLSPLVDVGQIEGGFVMGQGLFTSEHPIYDPTTGQRLTEGTWVSELKV